MMLKWVYLPLQTQEMALNWQNSRREVHIPENSGFSNLLFSRLSTYTFLAEQDGFGIFWAYKRPLLLCQVADP